MNETPESTLSDKQNAKIIIDLFHQIYYYSARKTWGNTFWMGYKTLKCPLDMWIYQEILFEKKPDVIIETGTFLGGSAFYMATLCDFLNKGKVITIDVEAHPNRPNHPRITYLHGSSTSQTIIDEVKKTIGDSKKVMAILDSEHARDHVLKELEIYSTLVTKYQYLIVEDSDINGHPVRPDFGPGPWEAVDEFMKENNDFVMDASKEKFLMTQNPNGYLKKIK